MTLAGLQSVDFGPKTVHLTAKGHFVTVVIEGDGNGVTHIDTASLALSIGGIDPVNPIEPVRVKTADKDMDGNLELVVKFDRSTVADDLAVVYGEGNEYAGYILSWATDRLCAGPAPDYEYLPCTGFSSAVVRIVP